MLSLVLPLMLPLPAGIWEEKSQDSEPTAGAVLCGCPR